MNCRYKKSVNEIIYKIKRFEKFELVIFFLKFFIFIIFDIINSLTFIIFIFFENKCFFLYSFQSKFNKLFNNIYRNRYFLIIQIFKILNFFILEIHYRSKLASDSSTSNLTRLTKS